MFTMVNRVSLTGEIILLQPNERYLTIIALAVDHPDIVNTTRHAIDCSCHIEDSRLAIFGEEFTFIMLLSGNGNTIIYIELTLALIKKPRLLVIIMNMQSQFSRLNLRVAVTRYSSIFNANERSLIRQNNSIIKIAFKQLCTELNTQGTISTVNYLQHDDQTESK